ncbi:hypothetical protein GCM10011349_24030 [Novosphingobium indicum]|uniref:RES domain-containing protein n=2 Tax=Novosphingobium indicum TaxID=462949 RepID=A0ABQ2JPB3_9SPHN|nr:hypothetical protein GCM10011349_24030 [Novosphingobium indicum]
MAGLDLWHQRNIPYYYTEPGFADELNAVGGYYVALAQGAKLLDAVGFSTKVRPNYFGKEFLVSHCHPETFFGKSSLPDRFVCLSGFAFSSGWARTLDRLIGDLGRLKAGWDGSDAAALPQKVLDQMEQVLRLLPQDTQEPEIEVDPSDSSVAARWWGPEGKSAFAMTFTGNGRVYAVASCVDEVPPPSWDSDTEDETKIIDKIDTPLIQKALTHSS